MHNIPNKLTEVKLRIANSANKCQRNPDEITLLAVSKRQSSDKIATAFESGQQAFGENYLQEALEKIEALSALAIEWHFIGPIQANKTRAIANHFDWVHSIDRLKVATRLNEQRPITLPKLNVCIQVNIDNEASKSGVAPADVPALVKQVQSMERLCLRGLMAIPQQQAVDDIGVGAVGNNKHRNAFATMHTLFTEMQTQFPASFDTLSMGMSGDLEQAVNHGSTMVRIGSDIFGVRT
ncbi:MAG: YggS family pyridoxal phosphate-dependent enzyme [Alteromonadaceae bacterium]|nr:MAG: YggS family pyridoxal phosphate-dependent enzyme [Alteromonadaceae bacterium]